MAIESLGFRDVYLVTDDITINSLLFSWLDLEITLFVLVIVWFRVQFEHARVSFSKTIKIARVRTTTGI